jgi:hypothetical protein
MDSSKIKKLFDYASLLEGQGNQFEKESEETEAIRAYIKMVDVLLLLAEAAPDYPSWVKYTDKAEKYQKRVKILIAKASAKMNNEPAIPSGVEKVAMPVGLPAPVKAQTPK